MHWRAEEEMNGIIANLKITRPTLRKGVSTVVVSWRRRRFVSPLAGVVRGTGVLERASDIPTALTSNLFLVAHLVNHPLLAQAGWASRGNIPNIMTIPGSKLFGRLGSL
jgi:hypothetical protein